MISISPTQSQILTSLRTFLLTVLPAGTEVIQGPDNRVPEPAASNFVVMSPIRFRRLATNLDEGADVKFTAAIAGTTMTVSSVAFGTILPGANLFGVNVLTGTTIIQQLTGPTGGTGTYKVSPSQTAASETMASGAEALMQSAEVVVQLDFHSDDQTAGDMAQIVSTSLRDPFGVDEFANQGTGFDVVPLHADDPTYRPFINESQQYEWRWVLEASLQANQVISIPQQYADVLEVDVVSVDAAYPVD